MLMIGIIDYGMGNLKSVYNAFRAIGAEAEIVEKAGKLDYDALVVPGVGAFADCMRNLQPFVRDIKDFIDSGRPYLGICLGLQILFEYSEEHETCKGLEIFKGQVVKLPESVKIPHMGWNQLNIEKENSLFRGIKDKSYVYFVHSYHAVPEEDVVLATTDYGANITAAVGKENIFATQFHPEKSGNTGLQILRNFKEMVD